MDFQTIIRHKRQGKEHSRDEIEYLVKAIAQGSAPDYQISAWAMAVCLQGMSLDEIVNLAEAMARSGEVIDLSGITGIKVDKHSTGGVGDKTTLVVVPLVAAAGIPVAKMSGRGLGHTGGTLDKLESIPGFKTEMNQQDFITQVNQVGAAVIASSSADGTKGRVLAKGSFAGVDPAGRCIIKPEGGKEAMYFNPGPVSVAFFN